MTFLNTLKRELQLNKLLYFLTHLKTLATNHKDQSNKL